MQTSVSSIIRKHGKQSVTSFADTSTNDYLFEVHDIFSEEDPFNVGMRPNLSRFEGMAFNYGILVHSLFRKRSL